MERNPNQFDSAPAEAFRFLVPAAPAAIAAADESQGKRRKFEGVAYSGDLITGHWFWGAVIFDLASTKVAERIPALVDHDRSKRAGWASLNIEAGRITASGELLDNDQGREVAADSDAGFPWQMSVHIDPARVEEVQPGARASVNGREITGPAVIFRDSSIREVSFTPTGADPNTSARAFARAPGAFSRINPEAEMPDNTEHAERVAALEAQLTEVTAQRDAAIAERDQFSQQIEASQREARLAEVRKLFADTGREFSDEAATPFLGMAADQFAAAAQFARAAAPSRPDLEREQATGGTDGEPEALTPSQIAERAREFHAAEHAKGRRISFAAAVAAVTPKE